VFKKILIANRSEIAVRVIRAARELGVKTVAVYSDADRESRHIAMADEAVCIGPGPSKLSYLDQEAVLSAAKNTGADAIHPGYGFLSENADFSELCARRGITFIGPPPAASRKLGFKSAGKAVAVIAKVPVVPGTEGDITTDVSKEVAGMVKGDDGHRSTDIMLEAAQLLLQRGLAIGVLFGKVGYLVLICRGAVDLILQVARAEVGQLLLQAGHFAGVALLQVGQRFP